MITMIRNRFMGLTAVAMTLCACSSSSNETPAADVITILCNHDQSFCACHAGTRLTDDSVHPVATCTPAVGPCCASPSWPARFSDCYCGPLGAGHDCSSFGEVPVATCVGDAPPDTGPPACPDKGYCGIDGSHCGCGLECLHLAAGSYTCGEGCSKDADCAGKTDPQSGKPYDHCALATYAGFCS